MWKIGTGREALEHAFQYLTSSVEQILQRCAHRDAAVSESGKAAAETRSLHLQTRNGAFLQHLGCGVNRLEMALDLPSF